MNKKNEIQVRRDIGTLMPNYVEDYVKPGHPARFIDAFVDTLDLDKFEVERKSLAGRPNYSANTLLKVWIYAYYVNIKSCRKVEIVCQENLPMRFLTGNHCPDHNTLWRFFSRNKDCIYAAFKKSIRTAAELCLKGPVVMALDGTKIEANVSKKSTFHMNDLTEIAERIISQSEDRSNQILEENSYITDYGSLFEEDSYDPDTLRDSIEAKIKELEAAETKHLSSTDPDARMMRFADQKKRMGYNAQAGVDANTGIVIAAEVTNEVTDHHQLNQMIDHASENLGFEPDVTVADAGYYLGTELERADELGRKVIVNIPRTKTKGHYQNPDWLFHQDNFKHLKDIDAYVCPTGGLLELSGSKKYKKRNYLAKVYRCRDFKDCPFRHECSKQEKGRTLEIHSGKDAVTAQKELQKNPENRALLQKRKSSVEPTFGNIKRNLGFTHFDYRGLEKADKQWKMICLCINLKKIFKLLS